MQNGKIYRGIFQDSKILSCEFLRLCIFHVICTYSIFPYQTYSTAIESFNRHFFNHRHEWNRRLITQSCEWRDKDVITHQDDAIYLVNRRQEVSFSVQLPVKPFHYSCHLLPPNSALPNFGR